MTAKTIRRSPDSSARRRSLLSAFGAAAATTALPSLAVAQAAYPDRAVRWVVAYPAGGGSDFLARQVGPALGKLLGQTIVIDNRPGAGGIIGTELVAHSNPDGYTLLLGDNGAMVFNEALYRKLPYSPHDLAPVGFIARFPLVLVANPQAGWNTAREWLDAVGSKPGQYSYASPGAGSPHHLAMELLKERGKLFIVHVPYRGTAPAMQDVMSGQLPMMIVDTAAGLSQMRAGRVKPLAVLSHQRVAQLPDVPTAREAGLPDLEVFAWQGLFVPRATPPEIIARLTDTLQRALAMPELRKSLEDFGLQVAPSGPVELSRFVDSETVTWHKLIKDRGLTLD
jgi:tripartite-type tricarboxylate transporter receptor subunit TctC